MIVQSFRFFRCQCVLLEMGQFINNEAVYVFAAQAEMVFLTTCVKAVAHRTVDFSSRLYLLLQFCYVGPESFTSGIAFSAPSIEIRMEGKVMHVANDIDVVVQQLLEGWEFCHAASCAIVIEP